MITKRLLILPLIVLLALSLSACGKDKPTPTAEPQAAPATSTPVPPTSTPVPPTNTPVPATSTPAAAQPSDTSTRKVDASNTFAEPSAVLDAYRIRGRFQITTTYSDTTTTSQDMTLDGAFVKADNAYGSNRSFQMTIKDGDTVDDVAIYEIGDWVSARSQGQWITVGRDNAGNFTAMPDLLVGLVDQFALEGDKAQNLGDDPVSGQPAVHYRIDDISMFQDLAQIAPDSQEVIDSVTMDVWVAQDGNYILKYNVQAAVSNVKETDASGADTMTSQAVDWSYEIYDANGDVTVELPADAPEPGAVSIPGFAEGAFPLPEGGQLAANAIGMPEVTSDLSQDELVKFYSDAFAALGWDFSGDFGLYQVSKGDVSFSMFIDVADNVKGRAQIFADQ